MSWIGKPEEFKIGQRVVVVDVAGTMIRGTIEEMCGCLMRVRCPGGNRVHTCEVGVDHVRPESWPVEKWEMFTPDGLWRFKTQGTEHQVRARGETRGEPCVQVGASIYTLGRFFELFEPVDDVVKAKLPSAHVTADVPPGSNTAAAPPAEVEPQPVTLEQFSAFVDGVCEAELPGLVERTYDTVHVRYGKDGRRGIMLFGPRQGEYEDTTEAVNYLVTLRLGGVDKELMHDPETALDWEMRKFLRDELRILAAKHLRRGKK